MNRTATALALFAIVFAGTLCADRITYLKRAGGKSTVETVDKATVTGWNAKAVSYKTDDGKTGTVDTASVISMTRIGGSMSPELAEAIELAASDPAAALGALSELASKGNDLDKEEASYRKAEINAAEARTSNKMSFFNAAIADLSAYTNKYKAGYFSRDAYTTLADFQRRLKKPADARATLKGMIGADPSLSRLGNQKLGELECSQGDWAAALSALKAAESASGDDKNAKYMALAWQGLATLKKGDAAAARTMLETVTNDEAFQDEGSEDEAALAVAYPALGDAYFAAGNFQKAYDAFVLAGYYVWWNGGEEEGRCLAMAYRCAKKLTGTDDKWKARAEKLKTALAIGYPKELQNAEKEG